MNIDKKWIIYGGIGTLVLVGGYYYLSSSNQPVDTTAATGVSTLPDLTFAAPPLGAPTGSDGLGGTGLTGTDALSSLINAFSNNDTQSAAEINAQTQQAQITASTSVFTSLLGYLNAHKGLHRIRAVVPNVGTVQIGPTPVTPAATLSFAKGKTTTNVLASNKTRITQLLKSGFKPV